MSGPSAVVEREKQRWLLGSTILNAALAAAKLAWGLFSGSTVVIADAVHSLSDVFGALLVYGAVRVAPHRSRRFPFGLYKLEDVAAVVGGFVVLFAAYEILRSTFGAGVTAPDNPISTLMFMAVVLMVQGVFYVVERGAASRLHSPGVDSDVANWAGDIGATSVVIIGTAADLFGVPHAQEAAVVIIVALIGYGGFQVLKDGILALLDATTAPDDVAQARKIIDGVPAVTDIRSLRIRSAGSALFLDAVIEVDAGGFNTAHEDVDVLEARLRTAIPRLESVVIHYEPSAPNGRVRAALFLEDRRTPATDLKDVAWMRIERIDRDGASRELRWEHNPFGDSDRGRGVRLLSWLIGQRVNEIVFAPSGDPAPLQDVLAGVGIEVVRAPPSQTDESGLWANESTRMPPTSVDNNEPKETREVPDADEEN